LSVVRGPLQQNFRQRTTDNGQRTIIDLVAAPAATAATATISAAATSTAASTATLFARARFIDRQRAAIELLHIQAGDRRIRLFVAIHFDEGKAFAAAGVAIHDHFGAFYLPEFREQLIQI
jgi:hypothetical protein